MAFFGSRMTVPVLVAVTGVLYLSQVWGARWSVVVVPYGILALLAVVIIVVVSAELTTGREPIDIRQMPTLRQFSFLALCALYYFMFRYVGFSIANVAFVFAASTLGSASLFSSFVLAVTTAAVMFGLVKFLNFNLPMTPLGF